MSDTQNPMVVKSTPDGLLIESDKLGTSPDLQTEWVAQTLTARRILVQAKEDQKSMAGSDDGLAQCPIDVFADFLYGLTHRRWSGVVSVDTGFGIKRIFFNDGEICFAASNVIDDRLGEVIYRDSLISLDQMISAAVKVDRNAKFGQVLLNSGIFTAVDLWGALKLQVQEIIRSIFLVESVYFEVKQGRRLAPTEVVFSRGATELIEECFAYGRMFKEFLSRVNGETVVQINETLMSNTVRADTFYNDFLLLIKETPKIADLVTASKLSPINTQAVLMNLTNLGLCQIDSDSDADSLVPGDGMGPLKTKIDTYSVVLKKVKDTFANLQAPFPVEALRMFAESLNPTGFISLVLDDEAEIGKTCLKNLYSQCQSNHKRVKFFEIRIESMVQFLLQLSGDMLPFEHSKNIRQSYRSMVV